MTLGASPRLYKYLDVNGALLTLRNRNFKHAKPSDFNDKADLTIESLFPEADEAALAAIIANLPEIIIKNIDRPPTCLNEEMRNKVAPDSKSLQTASGRGRASYRQILGDKRGQAAA